MSKRPFLFALALPVILAVACSRAPAPTAETPAANPESPLGRDNVRVVIPEDKQAAMCEPGKEHWRIQASPIRGGIVHGSQSAPDLDVIKGTANGLRPMRLVYESLLRMRFCFGEDLGVLPGLAKSWNVSPDGLTWTLNLRDGVKWHDKPPVNGRAFTSADVAWNIDFQLKGGALKPFWEGITHQEPNLSTIVIKMAEPHPDFLTQLAYRTNVMAPHEVVDQNLDFKQVAIGTGPLVVQEFKPGVSMTLARRTDYYDVGADGKPLPYIDGLQETGLADRVAITTALRTGQLEYGSVDTAQELQEFQKTQRDRWRFSTPVGTLIRSVWFNPTKKPWDDVRLRRAVSLAIARDDVIQAARGGSAVPSGFMPVGFPAAWSFETLKTKFKQDVEGARKLVADAGYKPGELPAPIVTTQDYSQEAEVITENLKAIGMNANVDVRETGAGGASTTVILARGDFSLLYGPTPTAFFPDFYMHTILHGSSPQDYIRLKDPEIDRLAQAAHIENDPAKRKVALEQLQEKLRDVAAYAPVLNPINLQLESCKLQNFKPWSNNSFLLEGLREGWLDPNGKC